MKIHRREALALLGLGIPAANLAAAQHQIHQLKSKPQDYRIQFFTEAEYRLVDAVSGMIIPADDVSPGAGEAKVAALIDLLLTHGTAGEKAEWKSGLAAWDAAAAEEQGNAFLQLDAAGRAAFLNAVAKNESKPATAAERMFVEFKKMTLFGYYTSEIGIRKDLGFQGNQVLGGFPGCTHPESTHK